VDEVDEVDEEDIGVANAEARADEEARSRTAACRRRLRQARRRTLEHGFGLLRKIGALFLVAP